MSDRLTIINGDCVVEMRKLPAESVHLCVTSPPYWGLRDYKIPPSIWGGDPECEHDWRRNAAKLLRGSVGDKSTIDGDQDRSGNRPQSIEQGDFCQKCNAWRGVFGLEPTPELYLAHTLIIFREVWRVLRKDGTLWINLGDSYSNVTKWGGTSGGKNATSAAGGYQGQRVKLDAIAGLKAGDLVGIPWRVALALQADGWFLRRDNIWFKPNPMPESVNGWRWEKHRIKTKTGWTAECPHPSKRLDGLTNRRANIQGVPTEGIAEFVDCPGCAKCAANGGLILRKGNWRCTTSHEYVFQFSKSDSYFCDAEAARERTTGNAHGRGKGVHPKANGPNSRMVKSRVPRDGNDKPNPSSNNIRQNASFSAAVTGLVGNRNRRSVWPIATKPFKGAHFATFPPALVRPIIQAASPVKCCAKCAAPWAPVVQRGEPRRDQQKACGGDQNGQYNGSAIKDFLEAGAEDASAVKARILAGMVSKTVIGYRPTCKHVDEPSVPAVVLDPFGGSGTVGQVAREEGRAAILIELSTEYLPMIHKRCSVTPGLGV